MLRIWSPKVDVLLNTNINFTVNEVDILEAIRKYPIYQELDKPRVIIRGDLSSTKVIYPINNTHTNNYCVDSGSELDNLQRLIRMGNPDLNQHQAYIEQYKRLLDEYGSRI